MTLASIVSRLDWEGNPDDRIHIVTEDAGPNFSAYVLGLDGCIATGQSVEEVEDNMRDAIEFHLEGCGFTATNSLHICQS